jgi:hypothetical protein
MEETKKSDCLLYGVDTCAIVTPVMVRDAVIACFTEAHAKELNELREFGNVTDEEFEKMKAMNVEGLVKNCFKDTGGDFENPTKTTLMVAIGKLAEFAKNFRDQKVVEEHYQNIQKLIECIKE